MAITPTIIHYIDKFNMGGAQSILLELFYAINKHSKHKQIVYCRKSKGKAVENARSFYNVEIKKLDDNSFDKEVLKHKPCVLIYHKLKRSDTRIYKKLYKKVPLIVINHTFIETKGKLKIDRCDYIVSVCNSMLSGMGSHKRDCRGKFVVVRNGVNFDLYDSIDPIPDCYDRENVIITGRINVFKKWKYSDKWIKWCTKVKLPKKMIHEYIGSGAFFPNAQKCYDRIKNKNNEVILRGNISEFKKKVAIIKSWDLFLYQINQQEGLSVSVLEALACGVPVICSDHYGNKEIIENGVNGFIFKNTDHAQTILSKLCDNPKMLKELKKTTRQHFQENNLDAKYMAKGYLKLVDKFFVGTSKVVLKYG